MLESEDSDEPSYIALGKRVAALRQVLGLSLRGLASASGLSASFLSQLENGRTDASVASLRKLAIALGVTPAQLLDDSNIHTRGVLRAQDRPTLPLSGAEKYVISIPPLRNLEVYAGRFDPGGDTGSDPYTHGNAQEIFLVTDGTVVLELGNERFSMSSDDSIEFLSSLPHRVVNESDSPASVLWINSPVTTENVPQQRRHVESVPEAP
ncbi:MAG: cupin domain-containing protein [Cryobacterium sp.]|nr:cupin domain-containing protein [Cryobacterium sp.]